MVTILMQAWDVTLARELSRVAKEEKLPLRIFQLDVNSHSSVNLGVKTVLKEQNRVDLLGNNLGYILLGCFQWMK
jgi:NADP-dependent 3-hydroxy acid dehydrogenase YdfG